MVSIIDELRIKEYRILDHAIDDHGQNVSPKIQWSKARIRENPGDRNVRLELH